MESKLKNGLEALAESYSSSLSESLLSQIDSTSVANINKKYKISDDFADDFNNCYKFLKYCAFKDTAFINKYSNEYSEFFSKILSEYNRTSLSSADVDSILQHIKQYNTIINNAYPFKNYGYGNNKAITTEAKTAINNVLTDILGITVSDYSITFASESYASELYDTIVNRLKEDKSSLILASTEESLIKVLITYSCLSALYGTDSSVSNASLALFRNEANDSVHYASNNVTTKILSYYLCYDIAYTYSSYTIHLPIILCRYDHDTSNKIGISEFTQKDLTDILANNIPIESSNTSYTVEKLTAATKKNDETMESLFSNNINFKPISSSDTATISLESLIYDPTTTVSTTGPINKFQTKFGSTLNTILVNYINSALSFDNIINAAKFIIQSKKIIYKLYPLSTNAATMEQSTSASTEEEYYAENRLNMEYLTCSNVRMTSNDQACNFIEFARNEQEKYDIALNMNVQMDTYGTYINEETTNDSKPSSYVFGGISFVYKEFNNALRSITYADVKDKIVYHAYKSFLNNKTYLYSFYHYFYTKYVDIGEDYITALAPDISSISAEQLFLFSNIKTNDVICQESADFDIIAYLSGSLTGSGDSTSEINDIQTFLKIYSETRAYFYKVLYNYSFKDETGYSLYEKLYIEVFSILRFFRTRLSRKSIDNYNEADCDNFLTNFGLSTLVTALNKIGTTKSLSYKKKIIANYNKLMSNKGSKSVIDTLMAITNSTKYESTNIYKYIICPTKDSDTTNSLKFIKVSYDADNVPYYIKNAIDTKKTTKYTSFIGDDNSWTEENAPESYVSQLVTTPQTTKYLTLTYTNDIYSKYIKSQYAMSMVDYLFSQLYKTETNTSGTTSEAHSVLDLICFDSIDFTDGQTPPVELSKVTLEQLYTLCKMAYALYISQSQLLRNCFTKNALAGQKYYGLSTTGSLAIALNNAFKDTDNSYIIDKINSLFKPPYYKLSQSSTNSNQYEYTAHENIANPCFYTYRDGKYLYTKSVSFNASTSNSPMMLFPLETNTGIKVTDEDTNVKNIFSEWGSTTDVIGENSIATNSAYQDAFKSVSFVNALNISDITNVFGSDSSDSAITLNEFKKAVLLYYMGVGSSTSTDASSISNIAIETSLKSLQPVYDQIINNVLNFPIKYLFGNYSITADTGYHTKSTDDLIDSLFNTFFTTDVNPMPLIEEYTDTSASAAFDTIYNEYFNSDNNLSEINKAALKKYYSDIIIKNNGTTLDTTQDNLNLARLQNILSVANEQINNIDKLSLSMNVSEDTSATVKFVITAIKYFISYTSTLYNYTLNNVYANSGETIPLRYSITEQITKVLDDYVFYDDSVSITDITD